VDIHVTRARICKRLRSTGIDSLEWTPPAYVLCVHDSLILDFYKGTSLFRKNKYAIPSIIFVAGARQWAHVFRIPEPEFLNFSGAQE
jgi:hypothetical protein